MRILLAVDDSSASLLATRFAKRLWSELREASIVVVHVHGEGREQEARAVARTACAILDEQGVDYTLELGPGDAAHLIVDRARQHNCDMIVIGTRRRGAMKSAVLGSVSAHVVKESGIPVVLVS